MIGAQHQAALDEYATDVMEHLEEALAGKDHRPGDTMPVHVVQMIAPITEWIAQEQLRAFTHNVPALECARWLASEIRKHGKRAVNMLKPN